MIRFFPTLSRFFGPLRAKPDQRSALLRLVAHAAEERTGLAPLLEAWAEDERSAQRVRLIRLARDLRGGVSLPDAIERRPGLLSDEQALLVRFGSESGALAPMIRQSLEREEAPSGWFRSRGRSMTFYAVVFVVVAVPIAMFLKFTLQPAFDVILEEFGVESTPGIETARNASSLLLTLRYVALLMLVWFAWSRFLPWPGNYLRRSLAGRLFASVRERRTAGLFECLGQAARLGRPLAGAVSTLARHHYDPWLRHKLLVVRNEMQLGADLWPSLAGVGLTRPAEAEALKLSDLVGNQPWTLAQLSAAKRRRAVRRSATWQGGLVVALVLVFAAIVLTTGLTLWLGLLQIMNSTLNL